MASGSACREATIGASTHAVRCYEEQKITSPSRSVEAYGG
jgi:hypothetical protein